MQKSLVQINQIIGSQNAITHNFGLKVYEFVLPLLSTGNFVELSFSGIKNVSSGFCNASIGKLFSDISNAKSLLSFSDISNPLWYEKIEEAIKLISDPVLLEINDSAISELFS
jgi:hypothetical protein